MRREAVALEWSEVDLQTRTALLLKTKTGKNSTRHLTDELVNRLHPAASGATHERACIPIHLPLCSQRADRGGLRPR